jgi:hypothetical protein
MAGYGTRYGDQYGYNSTDLGSVTGLVIFNKTPAPDTIDVRAGKDGGTWTFYGASAQCGVCLSIEIYSGLAS